MSRRGTTAEAEARRPWVFRTFSVLYIAAFAWGGFAPLDRQTWLLENLIVLAVVALLLATRRRFAFSNLSCGLIFAFLLLHVVGSHYTYSKVPVGFWAQDLLGLSRNHYDRAVHLAFGLLLGYPLREVTLRRISSRTVWSYAIPIGMTLALSGAYEIIEWGAARTVDPDVGVAYVGAQGDVWDGQKDMSLALGGAMIAMLATALWRRIAGREPYVTFE